MPITLLLALTACLINSDGYQARQDQLRDQDPTEVDLDGDGITAAAGDCDDNDPAVFPSADERVADGIDQDCDGLESCYVDADGDGVGTPELADSSDLDCRDPGESDRDDDCDDTTAAISPNLQETWYDGIDQDCSGGGPAADYDKDGDGHTALGSPKGSADDCDDANATISPSATDVPYDGLDQDCSGGSDYDQDGDGYTAPSDPSGLGNDCDDNDGSINVAATEVWYDGVDQDCSGGSDYDQDGDGYTDPSDPSGLGDDCDDENDTIHVGATEAWYDGVDQDCSGGSDYDKDGDGFAALSDPSGLGTDCNDENTNVHPGAVELCNTFDDNCVSGVDEGFGPVQSYWPDDDGDGYGDASAATIDTACGGPLGYVTVGGDPNDADPTDPNPWPHPVIRFDGSGYFTCTHGAALGWGTPGGGGIPFAKNVAAWVRFPAGDTGGMIIDPNPGVPNTNAGQYAVRIDSTAPTWTWSGSGGPGSIPFTADMTDGAWHLVRLECYHDSNGTASAWVDGVSIGSQPATWCHGNNWSDPAAIGVQEVNGVLDLPFTGELAGLAVWLNAPSPALDPTPGTDIDQPGALVNWVPDGTNSLQDVTGNGNACTWVPVTEDADTDGWTSLVDCDESDPAIHPHATEIWYDDIDQDCSGGSDYDQDGDGFTALGAPDGSADDCDDVDDSIYPGALEALDGIDTNCDGVLDDLSASTADVILRSDTTAACVGQKIDMGDLNGDAYADLIISAGQRGCPTPSSPLPNGAVRVVYGPITDATDISTSPLLRGDTADYASFGLQIGGDANGDGTADILIAAPGPDWTRGRAYLVFGPVTNDMNLWNSAKVAVFDGINAQDHAGKSIAWVGHTNDDTYDDFVVVANRVESDTGSAHLVRGTASLGSMNLSSADVLFTGESTGGSLNTGPGGDIDGDGYDDLLFGNYSARAGGRAYLVLASPGLPANFPLANADAMYDGSGSERAGQQVSELGDLNDDGRLDFGVSGNDAITGLGLVHIVNGALNPVGGALNVVGSASLNGAIWMDPAGDVDGDGVDDLIVASLQATDPNGATFLLYGPVSGTIDLQSQSDAIFVGESPGDEFGSGLAGGADLDGDGFDDIAMGAAFADNGAATDAGAVYIFFGGW